jgi:hypothetical protein
MRGLGIGKNDMAERLGAQRSSIEAILNSTVNDELIKMMANELGLHGRKLLQAARKEWSPAPVVIDGLKQISSSYGDMIVNTFVVWDEAAGAAWIFDTGTDSGLNIAIY